MNDKIEEPTQKKAGTRVLAVANQKGGVGKTTTAVNLATAMAACDMKVLLIDLDPQGNASTGLGIPRDARELDIYAVLSGECSLSAAITPCAVPGLAIVSSSENLSGAELELVSAEKREYRLRYVYTLKCELFRYENEVIDTDIAEIDDSIAGTLGASDSELLGGDAMTTLLSLVGVGTTALATVGYISDGGIRQISVTNRGGGYTYNPRVAISSSPGVTGIATVERISGIVACELNANPVAESIQRVLLTNPGSGYTVSPSVRFVGDGVGAAATAFIGNGVLGIVTITGGGSGYTTATAPLVTFSGISTVSAAATVVVSAAGSISAIYLTNAGLGYTEPPTITIAAPNQTGVGTFQKNEIVTGSISGSTARVLNWVADGRSLEIYRADGDFVVGEQIVGSASSASYKLASASYSETGFTSNEEIENEADSIIDFSERNPFGMP